jgi:cytochrome P450
MIDAMKHELDQDLDKDEVETHSSKRRDLDEQVVVATAIEVLIAGYDTSAVTLTHCLYSLARNPEVQRRLQDEIDEAFENSDDAEMLDYGTMQNLEYLDQVGYCRPLSVSVHVCFCTLA